MKQSPNNTCPKCKSTDVAEILYGMPVFSPKLMNEIKDGKTKLGGCCVRDDSPDYRCNKCGNEWKKNLTNNL